MYISFILYIIYKVFWWENGSKSLENRKHLQPRTKIHPTIQSKNYRRKIFHSQASEFASSNIYFKNLSHSLFQKHFNSLSNGAVLYTWFKLYFDHIRAIWKSHKPIHPSSINTCEAVRQCGKLTKMGSIQGKDLRKETTQ